LMCFGDANEVPPNLITSLIGFLSQNDFLCF
jgi:hypothetical protein